MPFVYKVSHDEKDELLAECDGRGLYHFIQNYCTDNKITMETMLSPYNDGKYLIYRGSNCEGYDVIEMSKGKRKHLYKLVIC